MNKVALVIGVLIFLVLAGGVVLGLVLWQFGGDTDVDQLEPVDVNDEPDLTDLQMTPPSIIELDRRYEDGVYFVSGSIDKPNPCYSIDLAVAIQESFPETVVLDFTSGYDEEADLCSQVITPHVFNESFSVSVEADIRARFDRQSVDILFTSSLEGEDLEVDDVDTEESASIPVIDLEPEPDDFIKR